MHTGNAMGDVALTNISRESSYFHDFSCAVSKAKVLRLSSAFSSILEIFKPLVLIKKGSYKKKRACIDNTKSVSKLLRFKIFW